MPKTLEVRRGWFAPDELQSFFRAEENIKYIALWLLMCDCGLRMNEALTLTVGKVIIKKDGDYKARSQISVKGKRNKVRYIPLTEILKEAVERYFGSFAHSLTSWNQPLFDMGSRAVEYRFKRICKEACITAHNLTPHSLRHTYAMRLLNNGVDPITISNMLGHKSLETTLGYLHTNPEAQRRVAEALNNERNRETAVNFTAPAAH